MGGDIIGFAAVIMIFSFPLAAVYAYYGFRVRKLRSEECLAAIARGVNVPLEPELSQVARSRRSGILLVCGALGYISAFGIIGQFFERDVWAAAAFGMIPLAIGVGYFLDATLIRRDVRASS